MDDWDDWFEFSTLYHLVVFNEEGIRHDVGAVKIGQFGMLDQQRRPEIQATFDEIGDKFFSLGQDDSYYEELNKLSTAVRQKVLEGLNDIAASEERFRRALEERVTTVSLMRSISKSTIRGQFRRIINGGARLSPYNFSYQFPIKAVSAPASLQLEFHVMPDSEPPSNVHVLIGRNGVGKTYLLDRMARAMIHRGDETARYGTFAPLVEIDEPASEALFAGLVSVSFSAFDRFRPVFPGTDSGLEMKYSYIGLKWARSKKGKTVFLPKSPLALSVDFADSSGGCRFGAKVDRWFRALKALETDPMFRDQEISRIATERWESDIERRKAMTNLFHGLSSGHKVVLLIMTKLVEAVEEKTLVLLDEPEAHLHPPLLSAFIRALSELLVNRNGVAIVATHSPVVLQEVPASCVWKLARIGDLTTAARPEIETFGENVGVLTREVFGLEVTESGFNKLISNRIATSTSYELAVERFGGQLGGEARGIMRALMSEREEQEES
jgi:predicted ATPase